MDKKSRQYQSKFMESYLKDLWRSIQSITKLLKDNNINFTIIGGACRNQYGYSKITEDIDLLVDKRDKEKMLNLPIGFIKELSNGRGKRFLLHNPKTPIDVIYTGEKAGSDSSYIEYENPKKISKDIKGIPFLSLKKLIEYKLASGLYGKARYKDFDDIGELILRNDLSLNYCDDLREDLKSKYIELWHEIKKR